MRFGVIFNGRIDYLNIFSAFREVQNLNPLLNIYSIQHPNQKFMQMSNKNFKIKTLC